MLLIGADPELFIRNIDTHLPVSIIDKLGGTKDQGRPIDMKGCFVLEDNCAAEFNIPPADNVDSFLQSIKHCIKFIDKVAAEHKAYVCTDASVRMPKQELADPRAWVFGCEPDYNAYTGKKNPKPQADDVFLRSAGGHVHIGFKNNATREEVNNVIRAADLFLGVQSVLLDKDTDRRKLYGKPGACRYKPYGGEYRVLSNFWIHDDHLIEWCFDTTKKAVAFAEDNYLDPASDLCRWVQEVINNSDKEGAKQIMDRFQ